MSTFMAKKGEVDQRWFVIDGTDKIVGRLAVQIATILRGKHRPEYTPHQDTGDFVIVTNVEKVRFTGNKWETITYDSYSGYPGGLKVVPAKDMHKKHPERILEMAIKRMMPKNRLARQQIKKLKLYVGPNHPHQAQQPEALELQL